MATGAAGKDNVVGMGLTDITLALAAHIVIAANNKTESFKIKNILIIYKYFFNSFS